MVQQAQAADMAVILLDVEGEYTHLHQPTNDSRMKTALDARSIRAQGVPAESMTLYHLVGWETANPDHPLYSGEDRATHIRSTTSGRGSTACLEVSGACIRDSHVPCILAGSTRQAFALKSLESLRHRLSASAAVRASLAI